jgi:hypothetical protein
MENEGNQTFWIYNVRNEKWGNEIHLLIHLLIFNQMWHISKWWEMKFNEQWRRQVYELFKNKMQMKNEEINNEQHEDMKNKKHELKINQ